MQVSQKRNPQRQHDCRRPELTVSQDRLESGMFQWRTYANSILRGTRPQIRVVEKTLDYIVESSS
jgi:hypothetical protein